MTHNTNPCTTLFDGVGICAYDRDECTVTLALDNEQQVRALVEALPAKPRVTGPWEGLLNWLREARPDPKLHDSDFSQGVIRGFDIVIAQIEHGHVQAWLAERPKAQQIGDGFPHDSHRVEVPTSGPVAKELLRAVMAHTNLSDPPTYNAPALANDAFLVGYRAAEQTVGELREALHRLHAWGECFIKDTPITAETLWREFPDAMKHAAEVLAKHKVPS